MVPLHHAGKAAALAGADDVDELLAVEDIDQDPVADLYRRVVSRLRIIDFDRHFAHELHRRKIVLAKCPRIGLVSRYSFTNSTRPIWAASYPSRVAVFCWVTTHGPACSTVTG